MICDSIAIPSVFYGIRHLLDWEGFLRGSVSWFLQQESLRAKRNNALIALSLPTSFQGSSSIFHASKAWTTPRLQTTHQSLRCRVLYVFVYPGPTANLQQPLETWYVYIKIYIYGTYIYTFKIDDPMDQCMINQPLVKIGSHGARHWSVSWRQKRCCRLRLFVWPPKRRCFPQWGELGKDMKQYRKYREVGDDGRLRLYDFLENSPFEWILPEYAALEEVRFSWYCDCKSIVQVSADGKVGWKVLACWCVLYLYLRNLVCIVWACAVPSKYPVYHSVATLFSRCALREKTLGRAKPKKTAPCATLWPPPA